MTTHKFLQIDYVNIHLLEQMDQTVTCRPEPGNRDCPPRAGWDSAPRSIFRSGPGGLPTAS